MIAICPLFYLNWSRNCFTASHFCCIVYFYLFVKVCIFVLLDHVSIFSLNLLWFFVKFRIVKFMLFFRRLLLLFLLYEVFEFKQIHFRLVLHKADICTFYMVLVHKTIFLRFQVLSFFFNFFSVARKFKNIVFWVHFVMFIVIFRKI